VRLREGVTLEHWNFGQGTIEHVDVAGAWVTVRFDHGQVRDLGIDHRRQHCILTVDGAPFEPTRPLRNFDGPAGRYAWMRARSAFSCYYCISPIGAGSTAVLHFEPAAVRLVCAECLTWQPDVRDPAVKAFGRWYGRCDVCRDQKLDPRRHGRSAINPAQFYCPTHFVETYVEARAVDVFEWLTWADAQELALSQIRSGRS
jgi:hypothetical protein